MDIYLSGSGVYKNYKHHCPMLSSSLISRTYSKDERRVTDFD